MKATSPAARVLQRIMAAHFSLDSLDFEGAASAVAPNSASLAYAEPCRQTTGQIALRTQVKATMKATSSAARVLQRILHARQFGLTMKAMHLAAAVAPARHA